MFSWVSECYSHVGSDYPTLKEILDLLKPEASGIAVKWYDLGIKLLDAKSGPGVLELIRADYPNDNNKCCKRMFLKWLSMKPDATWSQLVTALEKMGMSTVAADLNKQLRRGKYIIINDFSLHESELKLGQHY